jgi:flagellum-specific peptidoglycan hydrolase FlgJ
MEWSLRGIIVFTGLGIASVFLYKHLNKEPHCLEENANVVWHSNTNLTEENLKEEFAAQGIDYPEIVYAQAILETGSFKSYSCQVRNNLFGLRKKDGTYMEFPHWTHSVGAYKKYIQKYKDVPEDYYYFLDNLGYAEDTNYVEKLKVIVNKQ